MVRISWSVGPVRSEEYTHPSTERLVGSRIRGPVILQNVNLGVASGGCGSQLNEWAW